MRKRSSIFGAVLALSIASGCDSDSNDFTFSINADPSRTHAPGNITFELVRDDGSDVRICRGDWDFGDGVTLGGTYEATHTYKTAGHYKVSVSLRCDDQSSHSATNVDVYDTVDLSVGALEARPLDVSTDGNLSVSFQVSNEVATPLQVPTVVEVYLAPTQSATAYLEPGAFRIYRNTLSSLGGAGDENGIQMFELDIPMTSSVSTGKYYVVAVVNPDQKVGELSYENNASVGYQSITVRNQATDGADFEPTVFVVSPDSTSVLTSLSAQFKFLNLGSTTAENFHYEIWIGAQNNATDMEGAYKIHESTISGAISGSEKIIQDVLVSVTPAISEPGLYYLWLILDSANEIVERNETNNTIRSSNPIRVTNEVVLDADISIQTVEFTPSSATAGGTFTSRIGLLNQGSQRTGSFICTVFLSEDMSLDINKDHIVGTINVNDLQPNASREVTGTVEVDVGIKAGNYWVYAFCDSSGIVSEANEDNNIFRSDSQIVVSQTADVDLLFGQIKLEADSAKKDGESLHFTAPLCNQGTTAAGPFMVAVSRTNLCDGSKTDLSRISMDGLEPDSCQTLTIQEPFFCDFWCPSYQITLTADVAQQIIERNRSNNTSQLAETVWLTGDDCICAPDKYETNNSTPTARTVTSVDDDLTLCRADVDVFKPDVKQGQSFSAMLSHDSAHSPLKLELLRGAEVVQTNAGGDHLYIQQISLQDIDEFPVYLRVSGLNDISANRYHLNLNVFEQTSGIDLVADNLVIDTGTLSASEAKQVSFDIYNLGSQNAGAFSIGYYISQTAEIDDTAWRIASQSLSGLNAGTSTNQSISLILPSDMAGGAYHLIVRLDDTSSLEDVRPDNNTLRSSEWIFARSCWDVLDPNDSMDAAHEISLAEGAFNHDNLAVCQTNPDFYTFDVSSGSSLDIAVTNTGTGDFDLFLYDVDGNEIASARTTALTETIHKDIIMGDQRLILEVRLLNNLYNTQETGYSMSIQTGDAPSWLNCNDTFEPNDFLSRAYSLRDAARSGSMASICPVGDIDYYQIDMAEGDRLQIGFVTDSPILRAALYNPEYRFISMLTNLSKQTIDYTATVAGLHYLRIFTNAQDASQLNYQLVWLGRDGSDVAVANLDITSQNIHAGQNIALSFNLYNQGTQPSSGTVDIELVTASSVSTLKHIDYSLEIDEIKTLYDKVSLPSNVSGDATLIVRVTDANDIDLSNNETSTTIKIAQSCLNDTNEPNDNILLATTLSSSISASICPSDEDWYKLEATAESHVSLEYIYTNGDLVLSLYDNTGKHLATSDTATGTETVNISAAGTYYLRVRGATSFDENSYTISME